MTPTNQEKLDEMYEMVQENNEILHSLLRKERVNSIMRILYWLFVLAAIFGAFYYVQPIIKSIMPKIAIIQDNIDKLENITKELPDINRLKGIVDTLKGN